MFTLSTWANLEVGGSLVINMGWQEQFERVIPNHASVVESDDGQPVIKDLEGTFLPFSGEDMSDNEYRLSLPFRAKV